MISGVLCFPAAARAGACAGQLDFTGRRVVDTDRARLKQLAVGVAERNANSAKGLEPGSLG